LKEPVELTELRALVAHVSRATRCQPYELMMELGFELIDLQGFGYHCTPVNALAFGATGGDGVHLGLPRWLCLAGRAWLPLGSKSPAELHAST
jgi:hypothetical protein